MKKLWLVVLMVMACDVQTAGIPAGQPDVGGEDAATTRPDAGAPPDVRTASSAPDVAPDLRALAEVSKAPDASPDLALSKYCQLALDCCKAYMLMSGFSDPVYECRNMGQIKGDVECCAYATSISKSTTVDRCGRGIVLNAGCQ